MMPNKKPIPILNSTSITNLVYFSHTGQKGVLKAITVIPIKQNGYYGGFSNNHDFPFNNAVFTHFDF